MDRTDVTLRRVVIARTRGISSQSMAMYDTEDSSHIEKKRPCDDLHNLQCHRKAFGELASIVSPTFL